MKLSATESTTHTHTLLTVDDQGNIALAPPKQEQINHIGRWNEAWRIFSTIALQNPSLSSDKVVVLAQELLQYGQHINGLNDDSADWRFYDVSFRKFVQNKKVPFSVVDFNLVSKARARVQQKPSLGPRYPTSPTSSISMPRSNYVPSPEAQEAKQKLASYDIPMGYCFRYLASMQCSDACRYRHLCPWCLESHAVASCRFKKFKQKDGNVAGARTYPDRFNQSGNAAGARAYSGRFQNQGSNAAGARANAGRSYDQNNNSYGGKRNKNF